MSEKLDQIGPTEAASRGLHTKRRRQEPHFAALVKKSAMPLDTRLAMPYRFGQVRWPTVRAGKPLGRQE